MFYHHTKKPTKSVGTKLSNTISIFNVCGRIRTFGAFQHTSLAGKHHRPLGHANKVGRVGLEPTEPEGTRFTVWPATNYGIPTRGVTRGNRTPISRATICRTSRYTIVTVTPVGLEPSIFGLKGRCPNL